MKERFAQLRAMGIKTIMITGDNHSPPPLSRARPASTTSSPKRNQETRWTIKRE